MRERYGDQEGDDVVLYRFLKAYNFDLDVACEHLEAAIVLWKSVCV